MKFYEYYFKDGSHWNNWIPEDIKQSIAENLSVSRAKLEQGDLDDEELEQAYEASQAWLEGQDHELY